MVKKKCLIRTSIGCLILAPLIAASLWFLYRPWALTWGSTGRRDRPKHAGGRGTREADL